MNQIKVEEVLQSPSSVKKINAIYHDVECSMYDSNHPEIFTKEKDSWANLLSSLDKKDFFSKKIELLDIGTGTGFVVDRFSSFLKDEDTVNFLDISEKMLDLCRVKYSKAPFRSNFIQSDCSTIALPDMSVDIATINSVLHHLPNVDELFIELNRVIKPGGYIIIKHEPNLNFYSNIVLRNLYKKLIFLRVSKNKVKQIITQRQSATTNDFYENVVHKIKNELGLDIVDLTPQKLSTIVDVQSPTAGGGLSQKGFNPVELVNTANYKLVSLSTYNYYAKIDERSSSLLYILAKFLKKQFPNDAYFFDLMLQKHENRN